MPAAIETAEKTLATAMYISGDKATFSAIIKNAKDLYATQMAAQYTAEGSQALVDAKAELAKGIDDFIASVKMENLVDIDFSNAYTETPAAEEGEDPTYSIAGNKGKLDILGTFSKDMQTEWTQYAFGQGFNDLYTDALFFGRGDASVSVDYAAKENDVIMVSFDLYYGYLTKQSMGFYLLNENGDTISGYKRTWDLASEYNTLGVDESKFKCVGGRGNGNVQGNICKDENKTHHTFPAVFPGSRCGRSPQRRRRSLPGAVAKTGFRTGGRPVPLRHRAQGRSGRNAPGPSGNPDGERQPHRVCGPLAAGFCQGEKDGAVYHQSLPPPHRLVGRQL